jgi:transcriptional regulator with XRE-family HTH domain
MQAIDAIRNRILELCEERRITPNRLAAMSGISRATVRNILNGRSKNPGAVTLMKLCIGLDMTIFDFFDTDAFRNLNRALNK